MGESKRGGSLSKKVRIGSKWFKSITEAGRFYNVTSNCIRHRIRVDGKVDGEDAEIIDHGKGRRNR